MQKIVECKSRIKISNNVNKYSKMFCKFNLSSMRNKYWIILLLFIVFFYSCEDKKDESCPYKLEIFPKDTSLYVSYNIDGKNFKYYQTSQGTSKTVYDINDTLSFINLAVPVGFDTISLPNSGIDYGHPYFFIVFNKRFNQPINEFKWPLAVTSIVKSNLNYSGILLENHLNDSLFYECVSVSYKSFSTDNYFKYYSYNRDSIAAFNSSNVKVQFSKVERICNSYMIYEGTFSTMLYSRYFYGAKPKVVTLKNGKFRFIQNIKIY